MTGRLLFYCRDPGSLNQIQALLHLASNYYEQGAPLKTNQNLGIFLRSIFGEIYNPSEYIIAGKDSALRLWPSLKDFEQLISYGKVSKIDNISHFLLNENIANVITGASDIDDDTDVLIWKASRLLRIASHVILDRMINLNVRFVTQEGDQVFPDNIYLTQDDGNLSTAINHENVRYIGNIHRDYFISKFKSISNDSIKWGRSKLNCNKRVILFVSECYAEMRKKGRISHYNEITALEELIEHIKKGFITTNNLLFSPENTTLIIRPHPRDVPEKYISYLDDPSIHAVIDSKFSPELSVAISDIVVGLDSALLHDAYSVNMPVISLVDAEPFMNFALFCRNVENYY